MSFAIGRVGLTGALALLAFGFTLAVQAPSGVAAEQDASGLIEEIVVTSRRRQESQQDVPLSVTAFGAEQIEQIKPQTLRDFDGFIPNMYIGMNTAGPGASALYIRGVGYADIEKTQSPQVGVIVDGIQMGSSTGQLIGHLRCGEHRGQPGSPGRAVRQEHHRRQRGRQPGAATVQRDGGAAVR